MKAKMKKKNVDEANCFKLRSDVTCAQIDVIWPYKNTAKCSQEMLAQSPSDEAA